MHPGVLGVKQHLGMPNAYCVCGCIDNKALESWNMRISFQLNFDKWNNKVPWLLFVNLAIICCKSTSFICVNLPFLFHIFAFLTLWISSKYFSPKFESFFLISYFCILFFFYFFKFFYLWYASLFLLLLLLLSVSKTDFKTQNIEVLRSNSKYL